MNTKHYVLLSVIAAVAVVGLTVGSVVSAQTSTLLTCSSNSSTVYQNQTATFTAQGGTGIYSWSAAGSNGATQNGNQLSVSYPNQGQYSVTVTSSGQTAYCNISVLAAQTNNLSCYAAASTVVAGNSVLFTATGGNGIYTWYSPELSTINPSGTSFNAIFGTPGYKTMTVSSNGISSTCNVTVVGSGTVVPPTYGFPNTGGGYGH